MTPFGERLRILRLQRGITLKDMAQGLNVSAAYLSALEHGKRGRPSWHLVQSVNAYFNIIWDEAEDMMELARISHPRVTIDTAGLDPKATQLANRLAQEIARLDAQTLDDMLALVNGKSTPKSTGQ